MSNYSKLKSSILKISLFFLPLIIGTSSGFLSMSGDRSWYLNLNKPSFNPPGWIFGPVWTILYLLMGYALLKIYENDHLKNTKKGLNLFGIQMFFNFTWSIVFFKWHLIDVAFVNIIILWILIILNILYLIQIKKSYSWLFVPYLLWVSFASVLNGTLWYLNS
jgi:tryptophan-rich sensory protein